MLNETGDTFVLWLLQVLTATAYNVPEPVLNMMINLARPLYVILLYTPEVNDPPHICSEPGGSTSVGLVLADQDGVRDG